MAVDTTNGNIHLMVMAGLNSFSVFVGYQLTQGLWFYQFVLSFARAEIF